MKPRTTHLPRGCLLLLITTSTQLNVNINTASPAHVVSPKSAYLLLPQAIGSGMNALRLPEQPWTIKNVVIPPGYENPSPTLPQSERLYARRHTEPSSGRATPSCWGDRHTNRTCCRVVSWPVLPSPVVSQETNARIQQFCFSAPPIDRALLHLSSRRNPEALH